jgi:hypothetical protein
LTRALAALLALTLSGWAAGASPLRSAHFTFDSRYDTVNFGDDSSRLQGAVRIGFVLDALGWVDLIGHVSTGASFASRWATLHDFNGGDPSEFPLHFRRLYLQRDLGPARIQVGALPSIKGVASSTGIDADGWIDGARLELRGPGTDVEFVGGALRDLERPNMFNRDRTPNYYELEITQQVLPWLLVELSVERLSTHHFGRAELRLDLASMVGGPLDLGIEGLGDVERRVGMAGITAGTDALIWLDPGWAGRLKVKVYGTYIDDHIGDRGALSDDFIQFGYALQFFASGRITESGALGWFSRYVHSENPRITVGLKLGVER